MFAFVCPESDTDMSLRLQEVVARLSSAVFHHFEEASHSLDSLGRAEKFIDPAIGEFIR